MCDRMYGQHLGYKMTRRSCNHALGWSSASLLVVLFGLAGCLTIPVRMDGVTGPVEWSVTDLTLTKTGGQGSGEERFAFTLVLHETQGTALTLTTIAWEVWQRAVERSDRHEYTGQWYLPPHGTLRFPFGRTTRCPQATICPEMGPSMQWNIIVTGTDAQGQPIRLAMDLTLPLVPPQHAVPDTAHVGERLTFPAQQFTVEQPPSLWLQQQEPSQETITWTHRETGSVLHIVTRPPTDLPYPQWANTITAILEARLRNQHGKDAVTVEAVEAEDKHINNRACYRVLINVILPLQGVLSYRRILVYLIRTTEFDYELRLIATREQYPHDLPTFERLVYSFTPGRILSTVPKPTLAKPLCNIFDGAVLCPDFGSKKAALY